MKSCFDSAAQLLLHSSSVQVEVLQVFINETTALQLVINKPQHIHNESSGGPSNLTKYGPQRCFIYQKINHQWRYCKINRMSSWFRRSEMPNQGNLINVTRL